VREKYPEFQKEIVVRLAERGYKNKIKECHWSYGYSSYQNFFNSVFEQKLRKKEEILSPTLYKKCSI
jgi:phage pi2 protein 07